MNYANMIKEERLKQGFIIATLCSTIAGTFTTGINLYDRIIEKRKQSKLDKGQDEKIRDLERRVDQAHGQGRGRPRRGSDDEDNLRDSLQRGGPSVQREYEQYAKLDPRFAQGDLTAQLQLQSQVITLQSTVIQILEDALYTGQPVDTSKLYNASEFAREGAIRALRDQYRRMLEGPGLSAGGGGGPQPSRVGRPNAGLIRRTSSTPALRSGGARYEDDAESTTSVTSAKSRRGSSRYRPSGRTLAMDPARPLFCRRAEDLQRGGVAVDDVLSASEKDVCGACGADMASARNGSWRIEKEVTMRQDRDRERGRETVEVVEIRRFALTGRFLVKCHRERAGFTCYLCWRFRERDTLCPSVESLVGHVAEEHYISEYAGEADIREVTRSMPIR
ncbi:hypothetical protein QBC47DRAFT_332558 [Echria macrotheca]|uniref:Uncharacterized protein n=1 Tax=Echria macrotheca TaxID=438768 RepID=A0AAJ0B4Q3_9PEZI|nr:hypothetical protein QBC47DRAFT_332558 [Echria macrotheca]